MFDFDSVLEEVVHERETTQKEKKRKEVKPGDQREIIIRYATGREFEARVTMGTAGHEGKAADCFAALNAVGNLLGELCGMDGKKMGRDLVMAATKSMMRHLVEEAFE